MKSRLFHAVVVLSASFGASALPLACSGPGLTDGTAPDLAASANPVHPPHGHRSGRPSSTPPTHRHDAGDASQSDSSAAPSADGGVVDETDLDDAAAPVDGWTAEAADGADATVLDAGTSHPDTGFDAGRDTYSYDAGWPPTK
jgi:hypothetical protein